VRFADGVRERTPFAPRPRLNNTSITRIVLMSEIKEMPLVELSAKDLPAYCPNPSMPRWSNHPRVFIDVTHGEARCPYCSTRYKLREGEVVRGH
jgi:uncharacterized Zn-finger protein